MSKYLSWIKSLNIWINLNKIIFINWINFIILRSIINCLNNWIFFHNKECMSLSNSDWTIIVKITSVNENHWEILVYIFYNTNSSLCTCPCEYYISIMSLFSSGNYCICNDWWVFLICDCTVDFSIDHNLTFLNIYWSSY